VSQEAKIYHLGLFIGRSNEKFLPNAYFGVVVVVVIAASSSSSSSSSNENNWIINLFFFLSCIIYDGQPRDFLKKNYGNSNFFFLRPAV